MGETDSTLGGLTQGFMCIGTQDKAVTPYKPELDLPAGLRGYPGEVGVSYGSLWRQGRWWQIPHGILISMSSPGGYHFGSETRPHKIAFRLHFWDTLHQTTNRIKTQPHPSADRQMKVVLSQHSPWQTLLNRGIRPSSTHQWEDTSLSHQKACTSSWNNLTHQGADTRINKNYNPAA